MIDMPKLYELQEENGNMIFKPYDINKTTICGKNLEQIIQILNGIDLEKQNEMMLTMNNLGKWCELIEKDIKEQQERAIKEFMNNLGDDLE